MKSNVSVPLELVAAVYHDACDQTTAEVSDLRDLETIRSRVEKEGMSFLTITLPDFCKDFERSLDRGQIDPTAFRAFGKVGAIPKLFSGMLGLIFNRETGELHDELSQHHAETPAIVRAVRAICLLWKKVELQCSPEREAAAVSNFVAVERFNKDFAPSVAARDSFAAVANVLWHNCLAGVEPAELLPKHGPGATAEGIGGNAKYSWRFWYERLDQFFPFHGFAYPIGEAVAPWAITARGRRASTKLVTFVPADKELPVKVTLVPKTLKTPRVIAIEPVCMQYAQQAVRSVLYDRIERYWLTRKRINFRDQRVNQSLALSSSKSRRLATIDLSDASDRVPRDLALSMFDCNPYLKGAIEACRSTGAKLPDGRLVGPLEKFASMGSALCFPVEAMYFFTVMVVALLEYHKLSCTPRNVFRVTRSVFVYGDDLLVPVETAGAVIECLQQYNCKVNYHKSFFHGKFRESCGVDAYDGQEVTPLYVRQTAPYDRKQAQQIVSWVATAHLMVLRGYQRAADLMYRTCERALGERLPRIPLGSSALGRISFPGHEGPTDAAARQLRFNLETQRLELRALVPEPTYRSDRIGGYAALTKSLVGLGLEPETSVDSAASQYLALAKGEVRPPHGISIRARDEEHLERTSVRGALKLKRRWVPAT